MARVVSLSRDDEHRFSKRNCDSLRLLKGLGVEGDAHCGDTVRHRSRVRVNPDQPNWRQVHLVHSELLIELQEKGFDVGAGSIGENILTQGIDLLSLPRNTLLTIGANAVLRVTGLRNPCSQLDNYQMGLRKTCFDQDEAGGIIRKAGIMAVVEEGGTIRINDSINTEYPQAPHEPLDRV